MDKRLLVVADCIVIALIAFLMLANISAYVFHKPMIAVVKGISMIPLLHTGDVVLIDPFDRDIKLNDIVVYLNDEGEYVVHRVVAILICDDGTRLYVTKGDNDPVIDVLDIAILTSTHCRYGLLKVYAVNSAILKQVEQVGKGIPPQRIVGKLIEVDGEPIKIVGLCLG